MTVNPAIEDIAKDTIVVAFDRAIPKKLRRFAPFIWAVLATTPILVALLLVEQIENEWEEFLFLTISLSAGLYNVPWAFRYCCKTFISWTRLFPNFIVETPNSAREWFIERLNFFCGNRIMLTIGLGTIALAVPAYLWSGILDHYPLIVKIFSLALLSISAFVAGMGICAVCLGTLAIYRLGQRFEVSISEERVGILSAGITLGKCYFAIAFVWSFYVLSAFTFERPTAVYYLGVSPPVLMLAVPTFVLFLGAFIACQVPLRQRMQEFKRRKIVEVTEALANIRPEKYPDLTSEAIVQIEFLEKERKRIERLADWPFSSRVFAGAIFSSLYLVWPLLVNEIFGVLLDQTLKSLVVKGLGYIGISS